MLRFKTEEEFVKEFGEGWRQRVMYHWNPKMDFLLGQELETEKEYELETARKTNISGWEISRDMVTNIRPSYKRKKVTINVKI